MVLAQEAFTTVLMVVDQNNNPATGKTISYRIFDETLSLKESGSMTEIGTYGIYYKTWTPDADGYWIFEAYYSGADFKFYDIKMYQVGKGVEDQIYERVGAPQVGATIALDIADLITRSKGLDEIHDDLVTHVIQLITHDIDIKTLLGTPVADIASDIADLITRSKGLDEIHDDLATHDTTIQTLIGLPSVDLATDIATHDGDIKALIGSPVTDLAADIADLITRSKGLDEIHDDLATHDTDIKADLGNFSGQSNLTTLLAVLGVPDVAGKPLYTCIITDRLDNATYGLSAIETLVDDIENMIKAAPSTDSIFTKGAGFAVCPNNKSIWDALGDGTVDLNALNTAIANLNADLGDYSAQSNLTSLLQALGIPDVAGKSLYTCLITDRLDNATYGLSALETLIDDLENMLKASPSTDSILFKSGGATCPANKSIWDALGDGTQSINDIMDELGNGTYGLSALETLVDEIESLLKNGTYGLSALETLVDEIESLLKNGTYGLAALETLVDDLETWLGNPSGDTLTTITAKLGDPKGAFGNLIQAASTVTGVPATNFFDTNLTEATDDHYNNSILIFTSGNLAGQASIIVDYDGTTKEITVDPAFIETPSITDAFVIVSNPMGALKIGSKGLDQIFDLINQLLNLNRIGDTITTDGTEQTIYIVDNPDFPFVPLRLIIDVTNMQAGDGTDIKQYYRIKEGGNYILRDPVTSFADDEDPDLKIIELEPNTFGVKITITRTGGGDRSYDYEIYFSEK